MIKTVLSKSDFILVIISKVKGSALRLAKSVTYSSIRFFESFEIRYPSLVNRWPGKRMRIKSRPVSSLSRLQRYSIQKVSLSSHLKICFLKIIIFRFCPFLPNHEPNRFKLLRSCSSKFKRKTHYAFTNYPLVGPLIIQIILNDDNELGWLRNYAKIRFQHDGYPVK